MATGGGRTPEEERARYAGVPVFTDQNDLDAATRRTSPWASSWSDDPTGRAKARIGNTIYEWDNDAGWGQVRTAPQGTFPTAAETAETGGILNPLPTVNDGILNPSPTGGITDPNYKSLGEYLVGPTYTGPTTADEYVMQRAGGPAWDYSYPMYLGAGGYGPGNTIPTVTSTGDWTTTTPITDTTTDTTDTTTDTTDTTTTTTTTTDDDTIIREGPQPNNDFGIDNFRWDSYTNNAANVPMFPNTNQGATDYERYSSANPDALGAGFLGAGDPTWSGFASTGIPGSGIFDLPSRWRQGLESKNSAQIAKEIQMDEDWGPTFGILPDLGAGSLMGNQTQAAALTPQQIDAVMAGTATQEPTSFFEAAAPAPDVSVSPSMSALPSLGAMAGFSPAAQPVVRNTVPEDQAAARLRNSIAQMEQQRIAQNAQIQQQQEIDRQRLQNEMRNWQGRDEQDEARMAQIQAALDQLEDMQGTGILSGNRNTRGEAGMDETGYTDTSGYGVG